MMSFKGAYKAVPGKSLTLLILMTVASSAALTSSCRGAVQSHDLGGECGELSPAAFYLNNEAATDQESKNFEVGSGLRNFDPDKTISEYDLDSLKCWNAAGDPVSGYLIVAKILGQSRVVALDDDIDRFDENIVDYLESSAGPRSCFDIDGGEDYFFCRSGLPEAKYLLGRYLQNDPSTRDEASRYLRSAVEDRFFLAGQWIY